MKKRIVAMALALLLLAAALPAGVLAAEETESINVYNWGQYISDGSDGYIDVIEEFEKATGIHVNYTTFDSNETMYTKPVSYTHLSHSAPRDLADDLAKALGGPGLDALRHRYQHRVLIEIRFDQLRGGTGRKGRRRHHDDLLPRYAGRIAGKRHIRQLHAL